MTLTSTAGAGRRSRKQTDGLPDTKVHLVGTVQEGAPELRLRHTQIPDLMNKGHMFTPVASLLREISGLVSAGEHTEANNQHVTLSCRNTEQVCRGQPGCVCTGDSVVPSANRTSVLIETAGKTTQRSPSNQEHPGRGPVDDYTHISMDSYV